MWIQLKPHTRKRCVKLFCRHMAPPTNRAGNWRACIVGLFSMAFVPVPCISLAVHVSATGTGELNKQSPPAEPHAGGKTAFIRRGAARRPEGIVCNTAVTTSVPCSLLHGVSDLRLCGPEPCSPPWDVYPLPRRGRPGLNIGRVYVFVH
jgi:hypothetical protein